MTGLSNDHIQFIIEYLSEHLDVHTVILFGSAVHEVMRNDSDVDLAFLADEEFSTYQIFMKAQGLADHLGREVDLVDFRQASAVFKAQIVGNGKLLLDNQPIIRQYAFMRALKEYALLNEERKVVLEKNGYEGEITFDWRCNYKQDGDHQTLHKENT
ncbi:MAG: nucleotidyltransferase domain-containing protein [Paenibacillaceae bacterium]